MESARAINSALLRLEPDDWLLPQPDAASVDAASTSVRVRVRDISSSPCERWFLPDGILTSRPRRVNSQKHQMTKREGLSQFGVQQPVDLPGVVFAVHEDLAFANLLEVEDHQCAQFVDAHG